MSMMVQVPDEINEYLKMAASGDIEALASATWWALVHGEEHLGIQWFDELWVAVTNDPSELTLDEFAESRRANVLSNVGFLKMAIGDFPGAIEYLERAQLFSTEAKYAISVIDSGEGVTLEEQKIAIILAMSDDEFSILHEIYSGVLESAIEECVESWFTNWAKKTLDLFS